MPRPTFSLSFQPSPATAVLAAFAIAAAVVPARAQSVPEGQSCGGLLCDIGVLGRKGSPAPAETPAPAPASTPVPPPNAPVPRAAVVEKPRRHVAVRRTRPPQKLAAAPAPSPVQAAPPPARTAAPPPPVAAAAPRRVFMFQSIDPQLY